MNNGSTFAAITQLVQTGGVVAVLLVVLWLGLRGDVVTADQLADCRAARDSYLREWIRAVTPPVGTPQSMPPSIRPLVPWRDQPAEG